MASATAQRDAKATAQVAVLNRTIEMLQAQLAEARATNEKLSTARKKESERQAQQQHRQETELLDMVEAYRSQRDEARADLEQCDQQLRQALHAVEELETALSQSQRRSVPAPSTQQSRALVSYARRVEELEGQLAHMHRATAALREQMEGLAATNNALAQKAATAKQESARAEQRCANLQAAHATLTQELDHHKSGLYRELLAGAGVIAGAVVTGVAEARGIKLPSLKTAAPPPPPPPPSPSPPPSPPPPKASSAAPPAKADDLRRWRKLVDEQERRGWLPARDELVRAMSDQITMEDELAMAQAKHGVPVTATRIPANADLDLLARYAALQARMAHFKKASKNQDSYMRSTWAYESYQLDMLSEISLHQAAIDRRLELDSLSRNIRRKMR